jgi:Ca-activated chloride channel family protein
VGEEVSAVDDLLPFRYPAVLAFLIVPALLLAAVWRWRRDSLVLPFDHAPGSSGRWLRSLVDVFESIPALLLALVILILAGPQKWDAPQTKRVLTNIEFCVDVSGSMTAQFEEGTRYDASMEAINEFLDFREGDAFGLTFFGNSVLHWVPLTTDVSAFRCAPPFMRPGQLPPWFGGTEIGKALLACRRALIQREEGDRMIILVSDGYSFDLGGGQAEEIAGRLTDDGIVVYVVHIAPGEPPAEIIQITSATGGECFQPGDREALARIFQRIDAMQETRLEKVRSERIDAYESWARWAIGLLGACAVAGWFARYTPW